MVLISIQPFHLRKLFVFTASVLFLSSTFCFGDPLFMSVRTTIFDHRANRIQRAVQSPSSERGERQAEASIDLPNPYVEISSFAEPRLIAHTEIGPWLVATELDPGYSWSDYRR